MKTVAESIHGYTYGTSDVAAWPVSEPELREFKANARFTGEDRRCLKLACEVLADQTKQLVDHCRDGMIASIPNPARHTTLKKNKTDGVRSRPFAPLRDIIAIRGVINDTIRPYLVAKRSSEEGVEKMHRAWCKSTHIQLALWARPYSEAKHGLNEW